MSSANGSRDGAPDFIRSSPMLLRAYALASLVHEGSRQRGEDAPYIVHPLRVAARLHAEHHPDPVLAAALLHDVVEEGRVSLGGVTERFGVEVGELVGALTEDESIEDWDERKQALRDQVAAAGSQAVAIYAADKLSNAHDARILYARVGERAGEWYEVDLDRRLCAWWDDLGMLSRVSPESPLVGELAAELGAMDRERQASPAEFS